MCWTKQLANLESLAVEHHNEQSKALVTNMIRTYGTNLTSCSGISSDILSAIDFSKLQELELRCPSIEKINEILKTATNLKKLRLRSLFLYQQPKETRSAMTKIMTSCKSLQYLEYHDPSGKLEEIHDILNGIEEGLFQTKKWKRDSLKLNMDIQLDHYEESKQLMFPIAKLIHWFKLVYRGIL